MSDEQRSAGPGRPRSTATHAAILRAARHLLAESGYARLTMDGVASRAAVSKATLYRWWSGKAELVVEVLLREVTTEDVPDLGSTRAEMRALLRLLAGMDEESDPALTEAGWALMADPDGRKAMQAHFLNRRRDSGRTLIRRAAERGDLPSGVDDDFLIDLYSGFLFYRVLFWQQPIHERDIDRLLDLIFDGRPPLR
ncbi:TetR/AcrR family transcriptional regulator [Nonomuraea endophytica]|uniref:AcrR family transcriptional regulator n=1 Tax=Nonomuraea endophytica TaxID=714136 RepID=A0A7W7ZZV5_9ACTN|nr:TetR/AcrR family transcriptional regulator [Nonomuraea endophytica]MBB5076927.1 AcrR family transcriptional regulator [Nonomuraea endophytica]